MRSGRGCAAAETSEEENNTNQRISDVSMRRHRIGTQVRYGIRYRIRRNHVIRIRHLD
jgi:hypothetical protein